VLLLRGCGFLDLKSKILDLVRCDTKEKINGLDKSFISASDIAICLGVKRNTVSHYLNQLFAENILIKINTRPVVFLHHNELKKRYQLKFSSEYDSISDFKSFIAKDSLDKPFSAIVGADSSLFGPIKQLKVAARYPDGLPVLLTGPTGVGKTFLAQKFYSYCVIKKYFSGEFVQLNCAEYADNPELLTSILFGYKKGSFTGANSDHQGLFDKANGGMILLDEVHRLTSKGQEKLFEFLDHKQITPLGSTNGHSVNVRLVCATTENLNSNFLMTFLRRIPIQIKIPSLRDRTKQEKEQLIMNFFKLQQSRIERKIFVNNRVMNYLLLQDYVNNVGQLKNNVVLTVANALASQNEKSDLKVDISNLPPEILSWSKNHNKALVNDNDQFIEVNNNFERTKGKDLIYDTFINLNKVCHLKELEKNDFDESVQSQFSILSHSLVFNPTLKKGGIPLDYIAEVVDNTLQDNKNKFEIEFVNNLNVVLSNYLCEVQYEKKAATEKYNLFLNEMLTHLEEKNLEIRSFVDSLLSDIKHILGYGDSEEDHIFVYVYLENNLYRISNQPIKAIILAHGYSVASSIAETVNEMIGQHIFDYLNMPLNIGIKEIGESLSEYIQQKRSFDGLLTLVDMGSLEGVSKYINGPVDFPIGIINNVSTQLALEVGEGILRNESLNMIAENAINKIGIDKNIIYPKEIKKNLIITCCLTGVGTANKIKKLLAKVFKLQNNNFIINSFQFERLNDVGEVKVLQKTFNLLAVIGTANPKISSVPYFALEDLISGNKISEFEKIVAEFESEKSNENLNSRILKIFSLDRVLNSVTILDARKVIEVIDIALKKFEKITQKNLSNQVKMALYVHISCLVERLIRKNPIMDYNFVDRKGQDARDTKMFITLKRTLSVIENQYSVKIPDSEIGFVSDILNEKYS
jgi:sigma-54 dependent transcriptional regulator of gfr operon